MDENLQFKIHENLVARRSGQFQLLADLVKTPSENAGDRTAIRFSAIAMVFSLFRRASPPERHPQGQWRSWWRSRRWFRSNASSPSP